MRPCGQTLPLWYASTLERDGFIRRTAYDESPPRVEYELTSLGLTLREPLTAISDWSAALPPEILAARERVDGGAGGHADR